jgi:hypothetical protein
MSDPAHARAGRPAPKDPGLIEISLHRLDQLFNSFDPSPFHERELDARAEAYLLAWAEDVPYKVPLRLRLHLAADGIVALGDAAATQRIAADVSHAIDAHFTERARMARFELRRLFRIGRISLAIASAFFAICLIGARFLLGLQAGVYGQIGAESLTILAWVAMWRPLETYLYAWWPLRSRERNFLRMSRMTVEVFARNEATAAAESAGRR